MSRHAELVQSVTRALVSLAEREVDESINLALGKVGELTRADRCYVFLRSDDGRSVSNTHEWCAEGIVPAQDELQDLSLDRFPWAFSLFDGKSELVVPSVADVPRSAEREEWDREGIRSLICTPVTAHGDTVGFLGCDWVRGVDPIDPETVELVRTAAALAASAVSRRRAWRALEYKSRFEELVLEISTQFINLRGEDIATAIRDALEQLAAFLQVESAYLMRFRADGRVEPVRGWSVGPLVPPNADQPLSIEPMAYAWWMDRLRRGLPVTLASLDDVPASELPLRAWLASQNVASGIHVPLRARGEVWGFLGFAGNQPRDWSSDQVKLVELAAQVIANAIGRAEGDRLEAELQAQLRQTQKMEVVGQLAGGIAHDFNNLLLVLGLSVESARLRLEEDPASAREALEEVAKAAERGAALTRQLLTISRRRPAQRKPVALNTLVEDALKLLRRAVRESIKMEFHPEIALPPVEADPVQIEQVLLNLCVNASDATPEGGAITLATATSTLQPGQGLPPWVSPGPHALITVRDTGVGMDAALRERIFEPFFTTKPPGRGTGLGLSTVYGIVQQHRGMIRVHSKPGRGSTFEIFLPVSEQPDLAEVSGPLPTAPTGTEIVLLVEDDADVRRTVSGVLRAAGYTVLESADGSQALGIFGSAERRPDLVLLDAVMPGKSGFETFGALSEIDPRVCVVFTSGYERAVFPSGFFEDSRHAFLEKPYDPRTLLETVRRALGHD